MKRLLFFFLCILIPIFVMSQLKLQTISSAEEVSWYERKLPTGLNAAGWFIQEGLKKEIGKDLAMPDFSWLQTSFQEATFQHLCFRYKNQVFSILIALADQNSAYVLQKDLDNQIRECHKNNLIPCFIPLNYETFAPLIDGYHLCSSIKNDVINVSELASDTLIEMSEWEINSMGIKILVDYLNDNNMKVKSYCYYSGIIPQIWFEKNGNLSYVIVRSTSIGKKKDIFEIDKNKLLSLSDYDGYFADLQFSSSSPILKDKNGKIVPLSKRDGDEDIWMWRGDGFYCNFTGLQEIERAIVDNNFIKIINTDIYDIH